MSWNCAELFVGVQCVTGTYIWQIFYECKIIYWNYILSRCVVTFKCARSMATPTTQMPFSSFYFRERELRLPHQNNERASCFSFPISCINQLGIKSQIKKCLSVYLCACVRASIPNKWLLSIPTVCVEWLTFSSVLRSFDVITRMILEPVCFWCCQQKLATF